jgi:CRP-like cAMP-binding protein
MVDRALLIDTDFFRDLSERTSLSHPTCTVRTLRRGDLLFEEGDDCSELFVVSSGLVAISKKSIDGRESVVALMERGELFGEMGMLDGLGRSAEARALEPSEIIAIPYAPVRQLFEDRPALPGNDRDVGRPAREGRSTRRLGVPRRHRSHRQAAARAAGGPTSSTFR